MRYKERVYKRKTITNKKLFELKCARIKKLS
jgi:hypothetical protein